MTTKAVETISNTNIPNGIITINKDQRVTVRRDDIKNLNDTVNSFLDLSKQLTEIVEVEGGESSTITYTFNDDVISLNEITAKLKRTASGESLLKLKALETTEQFNITPTNLETSYYYDFKDTQAPVNFDGTTVGFSTVKVNVESSIAISSNEAIEFNKQTLTDFISSSDISTEVTGEVDNERIVHTYNENYATDDNFGTQSISVGLKLENKAITLTKNGDTVFTPEEGIGFNQIKVTPKLQAKLESSAIKHAFDEDPNSTTLSFIPTSEEDFGFAQVEVQLESTTITPTIIDETLAASSNDVNSSSANSTIIKESTLDTIEPQAIGFKKIEVQNPGYYDYRLSSSNILSSNNTDNSVLTIKSTDPNYILRNLTIPTFKSLTYEITDEMLREHIQAKTVSTQIMPEANTVYDSIQIKFPTDMTLVSQNKLFGLLKLTVDVDNLTPNTSIFDDSAISFKENFNTSISRITSEDFEITEVENENGQSNDFTVIANTIDTSLSADVTDAYNYQIKKTSMYSLSMLQRYLTSLVFNANEAYDINVYQSYFDTNSMSNIKDTASLKLSCIYNGLQLDHDNKKEIDTDVGLSTKFEPNIIVLMDEERIEVEVTEDNIDSLGPFVQIGDITTQTNYIYSIPSSDNYSFSATLGAQTLTPEELINFFNIIPTDASANVTDILTNKAYFPYIYIEFKRRNRVEIPYTIITETQEVVSEEEGVSITTAEITSENTAGEPTTQKVITQVTYDGITYNLTRTKNTTKDYLGLYTGTVDGLVIDNDGTTAADGNIEESNKGYVYDFVVTNNSISFYRLTKYNNTINENTPEEN